MTEDYTVPELNRNITALRSEMAELKTVIHEQSKDYVSHAFLEEVRQSYGQRFGGLDREDTELWAAITEIKADRKATITNWVAPIFGGTALLVIGAVIGIIIKTNGG